MGLLKRKPYEYALLNRVVGIDPGEPPKTVFFHGVADSTPPPWAFQVAIAERPENHIWKGRSAAGVISPAGWGMGALFAVKAEERYWVPTTVWKTALLPTLGDSELRANSKKAKFCAALLRLKRSFHPELDWSWMDPEMDRHQDMIDAFGIWYSYFLLTPKQLKRYRVAF
jgi:hypothetical protein